MSRILIKRINIFIHTYIQSHLIVLLSKVRPSKVRPFKTGTSRTYKRSHFWTYSKIWYLKRKEKRQKYALFVASEHFENTISKISFKVNLDNILDFFHWQYPGTLAPPPLPPKPSLCFAYSFDLSSQMPKTATFNQNYELLLSLKRADPREDIEKIMGLLVLCLLGRKARPLAEPAEEKLCKRNCPAFTEWRGEDQAFIWEFEMVSWKALAQLTVGCDCGIKR